MVDTIKRLMQQQHIEGSPYEWVAPYSTELNEVIRRRMRELVGQEKERVRQRNLAVKLRMLLELTSRLKRCGRADAYSQSDPTRYVYIQRLRSTQCS